MSIKKRVVHITTVHHPLDPRIYYKECQSLDKAGYEVLLLAPESGDNIPESGVKVISIPKYTGRIKRMLLSTYHAFKKARELQADYYHIHDPELLPVAWLLKKKNNIVIYDIHEDYETSIMLKKYISKPLRSLIAKIYKGVEKFFSRNLELCLAEKYYIEKYPRGTCILNYPLLNRELLSREMSSPTEMKLIYTGNVTVDRGANIHATIPTIDPEVSVYLYGRCPSLLAESMYENAGNRKEQVIIEGIDRYVPKVDIDKGYLSHNWLAGIALFPPSDHYMKKELTKFFEYMTAGLPVICSDFPVWREFIKNYACGIAVNPNNPHEIKAALEYLKNNENEARQMGKNGKQAVLEHLNWEIEERKLVAWYEDLWSGK